MEFPAIVLQGTRNYPALLPMAFTGLGLVLWACKRKRWLWATSTGILGCAACLLYVSSPANASGRIDASSLQASIGPFDSAIASRPGVAGSRKTRKAGELHALQDPGRFSSSVRLHPRFPRDFPIPRSFRLESNSGGARSGNLTVRFRFTGEAANAVCDLREQGRGGGWSVDILAPHRMTFQKNGRIVEAWFSYPAHSVVLDIPDQR